MKRTELKNNRKGSASPDGGLYPLRFVPVYKNALWGGRRFASVFGRSMPETDDPVSESWEIADHPLGESVIANGVLAGTTLGQLVRNRPWDLFGPGNYNPLAPPSRFPLILKYLDARLPLSVQVHPDDESARLLGRSDSGKTEAWIIVDAEPESELWVGTDRRYTRLELERAIRHGRIEHCLNRLRAKPGDCFYLRPGTLHALGAGILVAEIQTRSDLTFRIHDWDRLDGDGNPRPLHVEDALFAFRDDNGPVRPQDSEKTGFPSSQRVLDERMVSDPRFELYRRRIEESFRWMLDGRCHLLTLLEGSLELSFSTIPGRREALKIGPVDDMFLHEKLNRGDSILLPASLSHVFVHLETTAPAVLFDAVVGEMPPEAFSGPVGRMAA